MGIEPCDDEEFSRLAALLEKGDIEPSDVARMGATVRARFEASSVPWIFDRCCDVFAEFYHSQIERCADDTANQKIRLAALALVDALSESKKPEYFTVTDEEIWRRAAGERLADLLRHELWPWPQLKVSLRLDDYLRALVKSIDEDTEGEFAYLGEVQNRTRRKVDLTTFVIRRVRVVVDEAAKRYGTEENGRFHGRNQVAAELAGLVLNQEIDPNRVTQAFRGIDERRRNLKEAERRGLEE